MRSGSRQKRVLLLFLVGIVVPSLLLGYLAFRGIRNDQALLEKNRTDEQRRTTDTIRSIVADRISALERAFLEALPTAQHEADDRLVGRLHAFTAAQPLVEAVFLCRNLNTIEFPAATLLFVAPGMTAPARANRQSPQATERIQTAERLEFAKQDYPAALAAYGQVLGRATDVQTRAEVAAAIARVQKKAARHTEAIASYQQIARDFDQVRSTGGTPLGLAARMELASLYSTTNEPARSAETHIDLYESLLAGKWAIDEARYDFCARQVSEGVAKLLSQAQPGSQLQPHERRYAALRAQEQKQRATTMRLVPFATGGAEHIKVQLAGDSDPGDGSFRRFALDLGGEAFLVTLRAPGPADRPQASVLWGLLLKPDSLRDMLQQLLRERASSEETAWVIRGSDERVLARSERAPSGAFTVRAGLEGDFPSWSLEFYQLTPNRLTSLLGSRQGIYFYMFLLIGGILVFGLILTVRTVSHELELAKMKSDFVSTVSHEFKSPLTSIQQVAEMLQAGRVPSDDRRQQYYNLLLEQSQRLCLLTDNILNLARIEEGRKKFAFEPLDVGSLLEGIVPAIQDRVKHAGFVIELDVDEALPAVSADEEALAQAVTNLLDNAVKYSGPSRRVIVRAFVKERDLVISVQDFGVGIKKEDTERVFDRFYRGGDELTRSVKGSGLGLTLVKEIVAAHHGTVHVDSEPGQGSIFTIRLPTSRIRESGAGSQGTAGTPVPDS